MVYFLCEKENPVETYNSSSSLTSLCSSVACSNLMGSGVPTPSSGHRIVRLCRYKIFIIRLGSYPRPPSSDSSVPLPSCPNRMPSCSHQRMVAGKPGRLSSASVRSKIGRLAMNCATLVWRRVMYSPIVSNPASARASPMGGYSHYSF